MERVGAELRLSATDLVGHLACAHLTELEEQAALGLRRRPHFDDEGLEALWERGRRHEAQYVARLEAAGLAPVRIEGVAVEPAFVEETLASMRAGAGVIVQGALRSGRWVGRADVLKRVERESALGAWSYEPIDAKLARQTKAGAVLQLALYAKLLETLQGRAPEHIGVVAPWTDFVPKDFRLAEFGAYFRYVRSELESALANGAHSVYPDPVEHCDICTWAGDCEAKRRADDHLCLTAFITRGQIQELQERGVTTMTALAHLILPLSWKPKRGAGASYDRLVRQAAVQVRARREGRPAI